MIGVDIPSRPTPTSAAASSASTSRPPSSTPCSPPRLPTAPDSPRCDRITSIDGRTVASPTTLTSLLLLRLQETPIRRGFKVGDQLGNPHKAAVRLDRPARTSSRGQMHGVDRHRDEEQREASIE